MATQANPDALIIGDRLKKAAHDFAAKFIADRFGIEFEQAKRLVAYLWRFGMLAVGNKATQSGIIDAIKAFRKILGLGNRGDNLVDPPVLAALDLPRCGCGDVLALRRGQYRWNKKELAWYVRSYYPGINNREQDEIFDACYKSWQAVCGLSFTKVNREAQADIVIFSSPIDGPGRVLAQAQLPPGNDMQLWCQIDSRDIFRKHGQNRAGAYLYNTFNHETGHNLGLDHSPTSSDLLFFQYQDQIKDPQNGDIRRVVGLYGQPTVSVPNGGNGTMTKITLEGNFTARVESI